MSQLLWVCILLLLVVTVVPAGAARTFYNLPPQLPLNSYGNILIDRTSTAAGVKPVSFAHWQHREHFTCSVCHSELEFVMSTGVTEITEADNLAGRYCGACHNGKRAFAPAGNCNRCHSGTLATGKGKFEAFTSRYLFAVTEFGNGIDWSAAVRNGMLTPVRFLREEPVEMPFEKELELRAEMSRIPPAIFPHKEHGFWVGCNTCHPEVFNIKAKTTKHFRMQYLLKGEFCGACHLTVAFPLHDCSRCHPGIGG